MPDTTKNTQGFPQGFGIEWRTERAFHLGGVEFSIPASFKEFLVYGVERHKDKMYLAKTPDIIQSYLTFIAEQRPRNILELGIFRGGSVAFLQLVAKPERLLALELSRDRLEMLDQFVANQGLEKSLRIAYGVNQADAALVRKLTSEHLGSGRCIDVVFDDASHILGPTRSSFETLFPLIRPGGSYIVEDYASGQILTAEWLDRALEGSKPAQKLIIQSLSDTLMADHKPLHLLAVEAMLASINAPGIVQQVIVDRHWLRIIRGSDDIVDPNAFDLRGLAIDHFSLLDSKPSRQLSKYLD